LRSKRALQAAQELVARRTTIKDRFLLEELMGVGGMGAVFKARDLRKVEARDRNPWVAIKLLNEEYRKHPSALMSLQREARKSQSLAHPSIIRVFDFDRDGDVVFMTMELLSGRDLNQLMLENPDGMSLDEALPILRDMADALQYAHENQIIHADFSPRNVFLTDDGVTKVLDFGIAQAIALAEVSTEGNQETEFDPAVLGGLTRAYASKERLEGLAPEPADDLYGLGCIAYQLLSGRHPYGGHTVVEAEPLRIRPTRIAALDARGWKALQKALAPERADRPASAAQFIEAFLPRRRGNKLGLVAALLAVMALGVIAYQQVIIESEPVAPVVSESRQELDRHLVSAAALLRTGSLGEAQAHLDEARRIEADSPSLAELQTQLEERREVHLAEELARKNLSERMGELQHRADEHVQAGRLLQPPESSAYGVYLQMLDLDEGSERARLLADRIVQLLRDAAMLAVRNGDLAHAKEQLSDLRKISPEHRDIPLIEREIEQLQAAQRKHRNTIDSMLAQAGRLQGDSAAARRRELYLEVLALEPGNSAARQGLKQADEAMAGRVLAEAREQSLNEAAALVVSAEELMNRQAPTPQDLEAAYNQLRQAQGINRESPGISATIEQLHARYVAAIRSGIEREDYADADLFLRSATVLNPESEDLKQLRERLDSLVDDEDSLVPTSF
jgi:hypothetical protein